MKKSNALVKVIAGLFVAGLFFTTISCKKCRECTAYEDYNLSYTYYYESNCITGMKASQRIDDWEADFRSTYAGYYIVCNDTK